MPALPHSQQGDQIVKRTGVLAAGKHQPMSGRQPPPQRGFTAERKFLHRFNQGVVNIQNQRFHHNLFVLCASYEQDLFVGMIVPFFM